MIKMFGPKTEYAKGKLLERDRKVKNIKFMMF